MKVANDVIFELNEVNEKPRRNKTAAGNASLTYTVMYQIFKFVSGDKKKIIKCAFS